VSAQALEVVLVPGVAFDRTGHRLGHGQGYFDRFLDTLPADIPVIGLCFDFQLVAALPHEPHDHPVDAVLTN
jgi:5-formyltetrahydrofolate cyclo-ligase